LLLLLLMLRRPPVEVCATYGDWRGFERVLAAYADDVTRVRVGGAAL
jgi:hypothetical protein